MIKKYTVDEIIDNKMLAYYSRWNTPKYEPEEFRKLLIKTGSKRDTAIKITKRLYEKTDKTVNIV